MLKPLLLLAVWSVLGAGRLFAEGENDKEAIIAATKTYVAKNPGMTNVTVTVEQVEGDFARVKVVPENPTAADPAWVFLKKTDGKWNGLTLGTSFTVSDYQELEIPNSLRIP